MFELASAEPNECAVRQLIKRVEEKGVKPDGKFDVTVNDQGLRRSVRPRAEQPVAQRQPSHEHRQDHCLRLDRAPEHQREILRPDHFIDQSGRAGAKEEKRNQHATAWLYLGFVQKQLPILRRSYPHPGPTAIELRHLAKFLLVILILLLPSKSFGRLRL